MGQRSSGSATISFGLIAVPTKLYIAASAESFSFNMITEKGNRVKQKLVDSVTGEDVEREGCKKGYEHAKDQYVILNDEELKALEGEKVNTIDLAEFVQDTHFNPLQIERCYYLAPDKGAEKTYRLLGRTLNETKKIGIGKWYSRGRDHLVAIKANPDDSLTMFQMYYANEVRPFEYKFSQAHAPSDAEVAIAKKLVAMLASDTFDVTKYGDEYATRIRAMIDKKLAGETLTVPQIAPAAPMMDLLKMLEASVNAAASNKPATPASVLADAPVPQPSAAPAPPAAKPKRSKKKELEKTE